MHLNSIEVVYLKLNLFQTVATCISCSGTGESSACYETEIQASQIDATAGTVTVGAGNVFSLETCKLDSNYNQNYKSCEVGTLFETC